MIILIQIYGFLYRENYSQISELANRPLQGASVQFVKNLYKFYVNCLQIREMDNMHKIMTDNMVYLQPM